MNQRKIFRLKLIKQISYEINGLIIIWLSNETIQCIFCRIRRLTIYQTILSRENNLNPCDYNRSVKSFKRALLNYTII
jgi:hypothetical protein